MQQPKWSQLTRVVAGAAGTTPTRASLAVALLVTAVAGFIAWSLAMSTALEAHRRQGQGRLALLSTTISARIARFQAAPALIGETVPAKALTAKGDATAVHKANTFLARMSVSLGIDAAYVMNSEGLTLAASNWDQPGSFVGNDYRFRPYYREAIAKGTGAYYGVGVTTGKPGLFLSATTQDLDPLVVVVKIDLGPLEVDWTASGDTVALTDESGIVFLSSEPTWRYRPVHALPADVTDAVAAERKYAEIKLGAPLALESLQARDGMMISSVRMPGQGWTLWLVSDLRAARTSALIAAIATSLAVVAAMLGIRLWQLRREQLRAERAANVVLEQRVATRTSELLGSNARLAEEIAERQRTDMELANTRGRLVHATKLATLGRAFAGLAHEINQPLAALRTYLASTRLLAERRETVTVVGNIDLMREEIDRLVALTQRLKTMSRAEPATFTTFDVRRMIDRIAELLRFRFNDLGIVLTVHGPAMLEVDGDSDQIEQVVLNLISNAMDAVAGKAERRICITLASAGTECLITVADNGSGVPEEMRGRLFEPFFTTKSAGNGLGLGLATALEILATHNGTLTVDDSELGGAAFHARFPARVGSRVTKATQ